MVFICDECKDIIGGIIAEADALKREGMRQNDDALKVRALMKYNEACVKLKDGSSHLGCVAVADGEYEAMYRVIQGARL
jgi:hypothetical protein